MNRRAQRDLELEEMTQPDADSTGRLSREAIWRLASESLEEASASQPSSLSGMVAEVVSDARPERPFATVCELASGSTATVYLAVDQRADVAQIVAVKHYLPRLMQRRDFAARFVLEMSLARAVNHPFVCKVLDYGRAGPGYYTAMEFLPGEPLSKILSAASLQSLEQRSPRLIAHLIANLAEGLHAIHSLCTVDGVVGAVHQDITPSNLFVLFDGSVRVANFGSSWIRDLLRAKLGAVDGSYLAPEQLERGPIDARADVWALGVVLWEALAGQRLFISTTERGTAAEIRTRRIAAPSEYHPGVPAELDRIVLKALTREPNQRYTSARQLAIDLAEYLAHSGGALAQNAVNQWLYRVLPHEADRARTLLELANSRTRLPHFPDADEQALPTRSAYTPAAEDELEHTTQVHSARLARTTLRSPSAVDLPTLGKTISFKDVGISRRGPMPHVQRRWSESLVLLGTACSVILLGFFAGHAAFSRVSGNGGQAKVSALGAMPLAGQLSLADVQPTPPAPTPPPELQSAAELPSKPPELRDALTATSATLAPVPSSASANVVARVKPAVGRTTRSEYAAAKSARTNSATPENAASTISTQPGAVYLTTPGGGDVYEGGRFLGYAPAEFTLDPGWHTLVVKSGADNRVVTVQVPAGAAIMVSVPASKR